MKNNLKMKIIFFWTLVCCCLLPLMAEGANRVTELEKTPLPQIHVPPMQRETLSNGMRLLLLQDQDLPVVRGYLYIRTGKIYEPSDKVGLAALTGALLREGGTQKMAPDKFDEALAALGAEIQSDIEKEYGLVSFKCLKEDLPQVLQLLFEMLREPGFDAKRLELLRAKALEALRRQNDNPADIASREFPKLIYGKDNVWSQTPTAKSIQAITRQDINDFYQKFYFPNRIIFALAGDYQEKEVVQDIKKLTDGWPKSSQPLPAIKPVEKKWEAGVYLIKKPSDQTTLILGHFGDKRFNHDKYALLLLNEILGGDVMTSRLGKEIRSTLGLAYGIYSHFGLETDFGIFYVFAQTKGISTQQVLEASQKLVKEIREKENISEAELDFYKQALLNSLFAEYEPRYNFAKDEARFEYFGYPPNYLLLFRSKIQKVTLADLYRVAQKYLQPDAMKVLMVGDPNKIGDLPNLKILDIEKP